MILITSIHVQYDSFAARSLPPASFKQSQPWASRFERAEGKGGEEAGADGGGCGDDYGGGHGGDCGDYGGGRGVLIVVIKMVDLVVIW